MIVERKVVGMLVLHCSWMEWLREGIGKEDKGTRTVTESKWLAQERKRRKTRSTSRKTHGTKTNNAHTIIAPKEFKDGLEYVVGKTHFS